MCGIAYCLAENAAHAAAAAEHFRGALPHRGPDHFGTNTVCSDTGAHHVLACHRLSIINTVDAAANQPLSYIGGGVQAAQAALVCNGQIYNYKALAAAGGGVAPRTDVDVLGRMVLQSVSAGDGPGSLGLTGVFEAMNGDFAAVMVLSGGARVIAVRDPTGVRPLFYAENAEGKVVAFASEAKALCAAGGVAPAALPGIARVCVFPPGHYWDAGVFVRYTYVVPMDGTCAPRAQPSAEDRTAAGKEIVRLLRAAVVRRLDHSDRPVALLLSGGLDSAIVACLAKEHVASQGRDPREALHTFSIRYAEGVSMDDMYASMLAKELDIPHTAVTFTREDALGAVQSVVEACESYDPNTVRAAVPMYLLARHISENTPYKVLLSGEGADEVFMGYQYFMHAPLDDGGVAAAEESARLVKNLHQFDVLRADRTISRWGLEVRVPFLDRDLVSAALRWPGQLRMFGHGGVEKALLRDAFRSVPSCSPLLTTRIMERQKERFSDGCGLMYVPMLLREAAGSAAKTLADMQAGEAAHYGRMFDAAYGAHNRGWIVKRALPATWPGLDAAPGALGSLLTGVGGGGSLHG